jgi:uncharacterized membrane protein YjfL (UPF0719 family)
VLQSAAAINDSGMIAGYGITFDQSVQHAFVLTPIPEPGATAIITLVGLLYRRRAT